MASSGILTQEKPLTLAHIAEYDVPRELRDMIYGYFWNKEMIEIINKFLPDLLQGRHHLIADPRLNHMLPSNHQRTRCTSLPYYQVHLRHRPEITGPQLFRILTEGGVIGHEAIEWLYTNSTTLIINEDHLEFFLTKSIFESGVCPSTHRMRALTLECRMDEYDLPAALNRLSKLQVREDFQLTVNTFIPTYYDFYGDEIYYVEMVDVAYAIKPAIQALQDRGIKCTVSVNLLEDWFSLDKELAGDEDGFREDFEKFFETVTESWELRERLMEYAFARYWAHQDVFFENVRESDLRSSSPACGPAVHDHLLTWDRYENEIGRHGGGFDSDRTEPEDLVPFSEEDLLVDDSAGGHPETDSPAVGSLRWAILRSAI